MFIDTYLDPIPGGCNIEFPIEESPFMFVHNNPSRALGPLIDYVEFQPAAIGNERSPARRCDEQIGARLNYELYAYYEQTSTIDTNTFNGDDDYFHLISLMSNRKWLTRHSTMVCSQVCVRMIHPVLSFSFNII